MFAFAIALATVRGSYADFLVYGTVNGWRQDVGQTIERRTSDYYTGSGQLVDPEVWSDVGVHLESPGPLTTGVSAAGLMYIRSGFGQSFEVRWDQPISALWYKAQTPGGAVNFFNGSEFVGWLVDGELGLISSQPFDRMVISLPQSNWYGYLHRIEWGVVPGPGALPLACIALSAARSRRRVQRAG